MNPESRRYDVLLRSLFTQPIDPAKVFSYDATSAQREHTPFVPIVREQIVSIFKMHGAIEDEPPFLMPLMEVQEGEKSAGPVFLDRQGDLVMLPKSVVVPLARSAALAGLDRIKRFYCGQCICVMIENLPLNRPWYRPSVSRCAWAAARGQPGCDRYHFY